MTRDHSCETCGRGGMNDPTDVVPRSRLDAVDRELEEQKRKMRQIQIDARAEIEKLKAEVQWLRGFSDSAAFLANVDEALRVMGERDQARAENEKLKAELATARDGLTEVEILMGESHGVAGLHLNGDVAPWDEIRTGGEFERLVAFDRALAKKEG